MGSAGGMTGRKMRVTAMAKGELDYDDLHDFFERSYDVTSRSDGSWLFTSTSERYDGYTVLFEGTGLVGSGIFPEAGTITRVLITAPGGDTDDETGLSLSAADLAAEFEFGDHDDDDDDSDDGGDDDDDLKGDDGDDDISGDDGDDDISGKGGDDHIDGDDGDDDLSGKGGDDDLDGGSGDDSLKGSGGKDDLSGDDGNDKLSGQGSNDRLDGGDDDDLLIGGGGKDVFVFTSGFGADTIKRFDKGKDVIDLSGTDLTFADLKIERAHGDTIITTSEGTITIDKVSGGKTVGEDDFLF
jgi:Ca2+-binding RTX toxin-like protein